MCWPVSSGRVVLLCYAQERWSSQEQKRIPFSSIPCRTLRARTFPIGHAAPTRPVRHPAFADFAFHLREAGSNQAYKERSPLTVGELLPSDDGMPPARPECLCPERVSCLSPPLQGDFSEEDLCEDEQHELRAQSRGFMKMQSDSEMTKDQCMYVTKPERLFVVIEQRDLTCHTG